MKRVRDWAQVRGSGVVDQKAADEALAGMEIDKMGLDNIDRLILTTMIDKFGGGPVGLDTLAAAVGEDAGTIEDVYEPYLMQITFIARTPRGRICLPDAYKHVGKKYYGANAGSGGQLSMFDGGDGQ